MLREFLTRWGRRTLGFGWLFVEPLVFAFPVLLVWHFLRPGYQHGLPMMAFLWTGYMPLLIFRHVTGYAINTVKNNMYLLYHNPITPLDIFVARSGLEALGMISSTFISFIVFIMLGALEWPLNFPVFLMGFLFMTWWALAVALILAALTERSENVVHVWQPMAYLYIVICGFFFAAGELPLSLRRVALAIDPPLHAYEMIRGGLFGSVYHAYYDAVYLTYILLIFTFIGLWQMRRVREFLDIE